MLLSASWVLPVSRPPIAGGAVVVDGDRIVDVGTAAELSRHRGNLEREHFDGCAIVPGLVNAHTHLTLSALAGVLAPKPFALWLPELVAALKPWEIADHEASGVVGAEASLAAGVTSVGDIAYGAAEVARAASAGLGGVYYWELLGMHPEDVDEALRALRYPQEASEYGHRVVCGLSPHSPYTAGPQLLRAVHARAAQLGVPMAIHAAESAAEVELLARGTGPLLGTAQRTAFGFEAPHTSPIAYLDSLDVLERATLVHLGHLSDDDVATVAAHARGVVACPRSNHYLDNPVAPVRALLDAGITVGLGTDSSASNTDLDLMAEARALRSLQPAVSDAELLRAATLGGAAAIGVDAHAGSIEPGKSADLAIFALETRDDPIAATVARAGRETVRAVMSAGAWRVRDGALLRRDSAAAARAADARARSVATLATR